MKVSRDSQASEPVDFQQRVIDVVGNLAGTCIRARLLAREIGIDEGTKRVIWHGAMLHDIGKLDPRIKELVEVEGKLTQDEKDIVSWHPELGARIAESFGLDERVVAIIRDHHKRPDGTGYAEQTSSTVHIQSSIVELADTLDAMQNGRPGKRPLLPDEIIDEVRRSKGTHFHPEVADAFLRCPEKILGINRTGNKSD